MPGFNFIIILINIIIFALFVVLWVISLRFEKELIDNIDERQYRLKFLFSLGLYIIEMGNRGRLLKWINGKSEKVNTSLKALYVGESLDKSRKLYLCNKIVLVLLILLISNLLSFMYNLKSIDNSQLISGRHIRRPEYNQGSKSMDLKVHIAGDDEVLLEDDIQLEIKERHYNREELEKIFTDAKEYIDSQILYNNESADKICSDLKLVSKIPNTGLIVKWSVSDPKLMSNQGKLQNKEIIDSTLIWVTGKISYYESFEEYTRSFMILPKTYTDEENVRRNLNKVLMDVEEQSKTKELLTLPSVILGKDIIWVEKRDNTGGFLLIYGTMVATIIFIIMDKGIAEKMEKRNREMLLDYPEIVNKFTLLVGAGMSTVNAWSKISGDYKEKSKIKRYAYEEMLITYNELMIGTPEVTAYDRYGRRVKLLPYLRFSSLIGQNVKKGSSSLLSQLENEVSEAFAQRKELAKRMGEEAGTRLLIPMMLLLLIVLAIILVPAFLSFGF